MNKKGDESIKLHNREECVDNEEDKESNLSSEGHKTKERHEDKLSDNDEENISILQQLECARY